MPSPALRFRRRLRQPRLGAPDLRLQLADPLAQHPVLKGDVSDRRPRLQGRRHLPLRRQHPVEHVADLVADLDVVLHAVVDLQEPRPDPLERATEALARGLARLEVRLARVGELLLRHAPPRHVALVPRALLVRQLRPLLLRQAEQREVQIAHAEPVHDRLPVLADFLLGVLAPTEQHQVVQRDVPHLMQERGRVRRLHQLDDGLCLLRHLARHGVPRLAQELHLPTESAAVLPRLLYLRGRSPRLPRPTLLRALLALMVDIRIPRVERAAVVGRGFDLLGGEDHIDVA